MSTRIDLKAQSSVSIGTKLIKTGQTTSYRTGDDGDIEAGRDVSFLVLPANNPFGNTNRFTDEFGTQVYTANIVIDWSTYDGTTVLGYRRTINAIDVPWNTAIDEALTLSIGSFTSGWRLPNRNELQNISNVDSTFGLSYSPFNINYMDGLWSSTTLKTNTNFAWMLQFYGNTIYVGKINNYRYLPVRDFTVTGTTLT